MREKQRKSFSFSFYFSKNCTEQRKDEEKKMRARNISYFFYE